MHPIKKVYYNDDLWKMIESFIKCTKCNNILKDTNELCKLCRIKKKEKEFEEYYMNMLL